MVTNVHIRLPFVVPTLCSFPAQTGHSDGLVSAGVTRDPLFSAQRLRKHHGVINPRTFQEYLASRLFV